MGSLLALAVKYRKLSSTNLKLIGIASITAFAVLTIMAGFPAYEVRTSLIFSVLGYTFLGLTFMAAVGLGVQHAGHSMLSWLRFGPFIYIGQVSYMMYLIHRAILLGAYRLFGSINVLVTALATLVTIVISVISWIYFEKPLQRLRRKATGPALITTTQHEYQKL